MNTEDHKINLWRFLSAAIFFCVTFSHEAQADWSKNFGGTIGASANAYSITTDSSGNSYVIGSFDATTIDIGGVTLTRIGDLDIFVVKLNSSGSVVWAKNFGGTGALIYGHGVSVDSSGNVYLGGYFVGGNLTTPALSVIGIRDAFAIKLDSSGNTTWAKNFGGAGADTYGYGVAVDGTGNVYLTGEFYTSGLTTPALSLIGTNDAFAFKLDSSGNTTWAKNFGGAGAETKAYGIAVDASGNVYLGGSFSTADLTTPALTKIGLNDAFAIKLDSSGNTTWAKNFGGASAVAVAQSIAVDGSGNVYLGGWFYGANLSTPSLTKMGGGDAFAFKLNSSGTTTWAKNFGGAAAQDWAHSIAVDGSGNVYLGGYFVGGNTTTPSLTKIGVQDAFALKLDSTGTIVWGKNFGGAGATTYGQGIAVDGSGNVFLTGYFNDANLTTPALTKVGSQDNFAIKLNSSGTTTWSKNYGGSNTAGTAYINGIAKDLAGNIYVAGRFDLDKVNIDSFTLNRIGIQDAFVAKIAPNGIALWANSYGGAGARTEVTSIAVDTSGNVYLAGHFDANLTTPALTKIGDQDAFAFKLNSSGTTTWSKNFGGAGATTYGQGIAIDASGNVYLAGHFANADLTTPALTKIGEEDTFAFKLNSSGTTTWSKNFGGAGATTYGQGIAVDASGNVYLAGHFDANLTTPALTKIGDQDAFAFKLNSSGTTTWSKNFGGAGAYTYGQGIAVDASGNVYLVGHFDANLTTPALTKIGNQDAFAFKLNSSGTTTWSKNFGGAGAYTFGQGITVDASGNVYLAGHFWDNNLTTPALTKIGDQDAFAFKMNSSGTTSWTKNYGGPSAEITVESIVVDGSGNIHLAGILSYANLTVPATTLISGVDALIIDAQLYKTTCSVAGTVKFDSTNNLYVFCDGGSWQSMNNANASSCTGTTAGKLQYYSSGGSSDFVWYSDSCRSAKSSTTFGACAVNGKFEWDSGNSTIRGCINGTWTSLKGW